MEACGCGCDVSLITSRPLPSRRDRYQRTPSVGLAEQEPIGNIDSLRDTKHGVSMEDSVYAVGGCLWWSSADLGRSRGWARWGLGDISPTSALPTPELDCAVGSYGPQMT